MGRLVALVPVAAQWDEAARAFAGDPAVWLPHDPTEPTISAPMEADRMVVRHLRRPGNGTAPALDGKLSLRMAAGGPALTLQATDRNPDGGDATLQRPAVGAAVRFLTFVAGHLDQEEARRRARAAHPSAQRSPQRAPGGI